MFNDKRSKKVVLAAHCILNQNARISGCGYFPGVMNQAARVLYESGVGIIQLPCAELIYMGLDREAHDARTVGIREGLLLPPGQQACRKMLKPVIAQVREYQKHGFRVLGVIGIDGSPACGVDLTWHWTEKKEIAGSGGFIKALQDVFKEEKIHLPIIGIKDHEWDHGAEKIKELLRAE